MPFGIEALSVARKVLGAASRRYDAQMRPHQFEEHRFVGDKRTQVVYDLDDPQVDAEAVAELMASEQFASFGPDTLPEARNRGYRLAR